MLELSISLGAIVLACVFLLQQGIRFSACVKKSRPSAVDEIFYMTKTNDAQSLPPNALSDLSLSLKKKGVRLHADLKNYMR